MLYSLVSVEISLEYSYLKLYRVEIYSLWGNKSSEEIIDYVNLQDELHARGRIKLVLRISEQNKSSKIIGIKWSKARNKTQLIKNKWVAKKEILFVKVRGGK